MLHLDVQMDSNRDGMVDFDEFVAATLHVHQLEENDSEKWQKRSRAAFDKFDFDGDGFITADELKVVCIQLYTYFFPFLSVVPDQLFIRK